MMKIPEHIKTTKELREWLKENGFDGLCYTDADCSCDFDDLHACNEGWNLCEAGLKTAIEDAEEGYKIQPTDDKPAKRKIVSEQLKPCPCCGGEAKPEIGYGGYHVVACSKCELEMGTHKTKEAAIAAWNRRPKEDRLKRAMIILYDLSLAYNFIEGCPFDLLENDKKPSTCDYVAGQDCTGIFGKCWAQHACDKADREAKEGEVEA